MADNDFAKQGGEALDIGDEFDDSEDEQPTNNKQQFNQASNSGNQTQK